MHVLILSFLLSCPALAVPPIPQQVMEVATGTMTVTQVAVSSHTTQATSATQMDPTATYMPSRRVIEIQNQNATANLFCDFNRANVLTTRGREIRPNGGTWTLYVSAVNKSNVRISIYCVNDSGSGTSVASVTQLGD